MKLTSKVMLNISEIEVCSWMLMELISMDIPIHTISKVNPYKKVFLTPYLMMKIPLNGSSSMQPIVIDIKKLVSSFTFRIETSIFLSMLDISFLTTTLLSLEKMLITIHSLVK